MIRVALAVLLFVVNACAWAQAYSFGVLPQRSAVLTAEYWNPILDHVGRKAGVALELATRRSSQEYSDAEARGEFDFVYNNHIFAPSHAAAAYRVIARMAGKPIQGQIVVPGASPLKSLHDLRERDIGFPSRTAFVAYAVPMAELLRQGIAVGPVFGGNQEGIMAQLRAGTIPAAGVNSRVMLEYAKREGFDYRPLWTSGPYLELPVAAHPRVPAAVAAAVRDALVGMAADAEGARVLAASAALIRQQPPLGFVAATDAEYLNQKDVYRAIWKLEAR
ncbi:MAG: phosphate/phosphite/phosphonate ABC transporter substrate-binding protein [Rhodocyclales bacterium]|nr:phosphate/phosphite/phosphonate ABC transporter substrate-binding protein [Rhodocyclales bacterium]